MAKYNDLSDLLDNNELNTYIDSLTESFKYEENKIDKTPYLYHQDSCGQCRMVEMLLDKNNINYVSCKDIDEMIKLGIVKTPTLVVDGVKYEGAKAVKDWIESRGK